MLEHDRSPRSFSCRESLWAGFQEMSRDLECSVDYLLNDAMKQYLRTRRPGRVVAVPPPRPVPARTLWLHYAGQQILVAKDRFVIGRGKRDVDLTIKDPNVSRTHALIELRQGRWHLVDLGSLNGIEAPQPGGASSSPARSRTSSEAPTELATGRITDRPLVEGDMFKICDHILHVTFRRLAR